jgi:hypothetical protein
MTSETQIDTAKSFARGLSDIEGVLSSHADDWDNYGGFNIIVSLNMTGRNGAYRFASRGYSMRKITNEIRRRIKNFNAYIKQVPVRQYERSFGETYFTGYDYNYIMLDLRVPE